VWTRTFDFDDPEPPGMDPEPDSLSRTIGKFVLFAAIIVLASVEITETCDRISRITGLGNSFLGALLLATVSSLPEITLSISLVRLNQASMAIGNLIGSNFFNIAIFPLADFFLKGSLYRHFSYSHAIPVFFLALSSTILLLAVGKNRKFAVVAAKFMLLSYLSGMALLYLNS
jgi:cation:H+ antiporter